MFTILGIICVDSKEISNFVAFEFKVNTFVLYPELNRLICFVSKINRFNLFCVNSKLVCNWNAVQNPVREVRRIIIVKAFSVITANIVTIIIVVIVIVIVIV